ncbi:MAG: hypothetical protein HOO93_09330 [Methyloglobulus sp.]|nr:hypothetical protein [Methyloglobulus sp.]
MKKFLFIIIALISLSTAGYIIFNKYLAKRDLDTLGIVFSGHTFVKSACMGNKKAVLLFIKAGIDINTIGENGLTALHCAAMTGDTETLSAILQEKSNVNFKAEGNINPLMTPLHMAVMKEKNEAVKLLLDAGADINANTPLGTPLFLAARKSNKAMVTTLIKRGADTLVKDRWGGTVLHAVAQSSQPDEVADFFLTNGVDVNAKGHNGETALHTALSNNSFGMYLTTESAQRHISFIENLINHGADVNAVTENGETPLLISIRTNVKDKMAISLLLKNRADPNIHDKEGKTPLIAAVLGGDMAIVEMLLEAGAKTDGKWGALGTPLHAAAHQGNLAIAELLLHRGADVNAVDCCNGTTVLNTAVEMSNPNTEKFVSLLLDWGANVNAKDGSGRTPLIEARNSILPVVQLLVSKGANVNDIDRGGNSVLWWFRNRHSEAIEYLISKGARE